MTPEELEQWLEARPEETRHSEAVWIAHRCAMRVLPVGLNIAHKVGLEVSTMLRANLVLSVASLRSSDELTTAVVAATRAAEAYIGASNESYSRLSSDGWRSDPLDRPAAATHASMRASLRDGGVTAAASALAAAATAFQPVEDEVSEDVQSLEAEYDLDSLQLWSVSDAPEKILVTWAFGEKNPWDFWINWYLRALEGTPQPMALLEKIALQPDEFWQGTDGEVNTRIAEIVAEWEAGQEQDDPDRVDLFVATLFDFSYDKLEAVMRAVPVKGDWKRLEDENRVSAFLGDAEDLRESFELLCTALKAEGRTMQGAAGISTYIDAILATLEKAELGQGLRVDKLMEYGRILEGASQDDATMREFGALGTALKTNAENLRQIVRDHFAHTIARFSDLKDIRLEDGVSEWSALAQFREVVAQVKTGANGSLPPLAKDDAVMLEDVLESVDRLIRSKEIATSEEAKSSFRRDIDFQLAKVGATTAIYREKAERIGKKPIAVVDDGLKWNRRGEGLMGFGRWVWDYIKNGGGA